MKSENFALTRYDADEGMVFDWVEERKVEIEEGVFESEHLYVKTVFIGDNDNIENYKEVPESERDEWLALQEQKEKEREEKERERISNLK